MKDYFRHWPSSFNLLCARPKGITSLDALDAGCGFRLAARISELRAEGYAIAATTVRTPQGAHIARYRLVEQVSA